MIKKIEMQLCEYKAAQESAQHHDKEAWNRFSIVSVIMSGLLAILASTNNNVNVILKIAFSFFGIFLATLLIFFHLHYADIIGKKYAICKKIEDDLKMNGNHKDSPKSRFREYFILIMIFFIILWTLYLASLLKIGA